MDTHNTNKKNNPQFVFFYLLSLVSLIFFAISVAMIVFQMINKFIVDTPLMSPEPFSPEMLKFVVSALIVSIPIFYFTTFKIFQKLYSGIMKEDSGIRRWLTYFIVFVTSVIMLGWLIGIINSFLNGDLTSKFILKALFAILLSAFIFSFYLYDIKRKVVEGQKSSVLRMYFYVSVVLAAVVLFFGIFYVESPKTVRLKKVDNLIMNNFSSIENEINVYYSQNKTLPEDLNQIIEDYQYDQNIFSDPENKELLVYKKIDKISYELCANFRTSNLIVENQDYYTRMQKHDIGNQCLIRKVNTEIPPAVKTIY